MEKQELKKSEETGLNVFATPESFEVAQRVAKALAQSTLVPKEYQNNVPNTLIALEMSNRIGASPLMVMQHLYIVHGKPSWSSSFLISAINSCGRFEPLRFEVSGKGESLSCFAWTKDKSGNKLEGPVVDMAMAKAEGWVQKNGSKWKTMPELMIRYRAAAFFSRLYCPEITMGMQTAEEVVDITYQEVNDDPAPNPLEFEEQQQKAKENKQTSTKDEKASENNNGQLFQ
jgi:hypothetical protein